MESLFRQSVTIKASPARVWEVLFTDHYYRRWTVPFSPGCYFEGTWELGSEMRFLGDGGEGLLSVVSSAVPLQELVLTHQHEIKAGLSVEDALAQAKETGWYGAKESYLLTSNSDGETVLTASLEMPPQGFEFMVQMWEGALKLIVEIAEGE